MTSLTVTLNILSVDCSHLNRALEIRQKQADFIYTLKAFLILLPISIHLEQTVNRKVSILAYKEISMTMIKKWNYYLNKM